MKYIKLLICSLLILVCYSITSTLQAAVSGKTTVPASQLVAYYNTKFDESTKFQITNTNFSDGVTLHIQILDGTCEEVDRFISLTHNETTVLDLDEEVGGADQSGIIVVNAVGAVNDFVPVDFPFLVGTTWIIDDDSCDPGFTPCDNPDNLSNANAVGRDLVGGAVFETIQPTDVYAPFSDLDFFGDNELIAASWTDNYAGGYIATSGAAGTTANPIGLFIIDDMEVKDSCGDFDVECLFEGPFTLAFGPDFGDAEVVSYVCDKNSEDYGIAQMLQFGYSSASANLIALSRGEGAELDSESAGMDYAISVGQATPPPVDCSVDPCDKGAACLSECQALECTDLESCVDDPELCDGVEVVPGAVCDGEGGATEVLCDDGIDNNENDALDCADPDCANATNCQNTGGGGGGNSGCSLAGSTVGFANALLLLIPALGIAIRRRLIG